MRTRKCPRLLDAAARVRFVEDGFVTSGNPNGYSIFKTLKPVLMLNKHEQQPPTTRQRHD